MYDIRLTMATFSETKTTISTSIGQSEEINIDVGVYQGSILSPLLFIIIMEEVRKWVRMNNYY